MEKIKDFPLFILFFFYVSFFSRISSKWVVFVEYRPTWMLVLIDDMKSSVSLYLSLSVMLPHHLWQHWETQLLRVFSQITFFIYSPFLRNGSNQSQIPHCPICDAHHGDCQSNMNASYTYIHAHIHRSLSISWARDALHNKEWFIRRKTKFWSFETDRKT